TVVNVNGFGFTPVPLEPIRSDDDIGPASATVFALSAVGKSGVAGAMTGGRFAPAESADSGSLAVAPGSAPPLIPFLREGPLGGGIVKSNPGSFFDDYGIRTNHFPGYSPWGGGLAFDARKQLIMTDPHNHQVGWYEHGILTRLVGGPQRSPQAASAKPG